MPPSLPGIRIKVVDPCYEAQEFEIPKGITRSFWANTFFLYGFLVDPITGAFWDYDERFSVPVRKKSSCR